MKILLRWFNLNSLKANPGKFVYILGRRIQPKYCLTIGSVDVKESDYVELLEITNIYKH